MMRSNMQGKRSKARPAVQLLLISGILCGIPLLVFSAGANPDALLATMQRELQRASAALAKSDPAPYYLSYSVSDFDGATVAAMNGSLLVSSHATAASGGRGNARGLVRAGQYAWPEPGLRDEFGHCFPWMEIRTPRLACFGSLPIANTSGLLRRLCK